MGRVYEFIIGFIFMAMLLLMLIAGGYSETHYSTIAKVYSIEDNKITLIDGAGYLWIVENRPDLKKDDFVKIKFFNNTTDYTREDDIILKVIKLED
jgi:hypothetical protein